MRWAKQKSRNKGELEEYRNIGSKLYNEREGKKYEKE